MTLALALAPLYVRQELRDVVCFVQTQYSRCHSLSITTAPKSKVVSKLETRKLRRVQTRKGFAALQPFLADDG